MSQVFERGGLDPQRVAQIVAGREAGPHRLGSGYRMSGDVVLTAAHVVHDTRSVRVRFLTASGGVREWAADPVWVDDVVDIALLRITDAGPVGHVTPVRFAAVAGVVDCEALGFPRFNLRPGTTSTGGRGVAPGAYRDSHHALGHTSPWSDLRTGTLEISVGAPEHDPRPDRSPWEGMSGAPVWSGGRMIGVVSEHHLSKGLGRLSASRVSLWYQRLSPARLAELGDLIGLPADPGQLDRLPRPSAPLSGPAWLREAAESLAVDMGGQWREELERRQAGEAFPLPVRFHPARRDLSDHWTSIRGAPAGADPGPLPLAGEVERILEVYRSVPSRRLMVLGAAGAGKTVLTLRFALDWLDGRASGDTVPVIFGLGSWNPGATALREWMCDQLVRDHVSLAAPAPGTRGGNLANALLDAGWILPVLDGFDEIAQGLRGEALRALNRTAMPLLITSRPTEYTTAVAGARVLTAAAAVTLEALAPTDAADYLRRASGPGADGGLHSTVWEPVLAALRQRPGDRGCANLAMVLTNPLMVAMARAIYSDARRHDPRELLNTARFASPDALREHLLAEFTPAVYKQPSPGRRTGRRPRWSPEDAQDWLGYLADHLDRLGTPHLAWWQVGATMRRSRRILVVGVVTALVFGLTTGIGNVPVDLVATSLGLGFALKRGLVVGLLHGLVAGLVFGIAYGFVSRERTQPSRVRVRLRRRGRGQRRGTGSARMFLVGFGFGTLVALALVVVDRSVVTWWGLDDGLGGDAAGGWVFVPGLGLGAGLVLALMAWLEVPVDVGSTAASADLLRINRRNAVANLLVWAMVFGLLAGVANTLLFGPLFGFLAGLAFGVEAALAGGFGYRISMTAWGQWLAFARIWLPLRGRLPFRMIAFLDDACERGVLRRTGAVYQFRHVELQGHLVRAFRAGRDRRPAASPAALPATGHPEGATVGGRDGIDHYDGRPPAGAVRVSDGRSFR